MREELIHKLVWEGKKKESLPVIEGNVYYCFPNLIAEVALLPGTFKAAYWQLNREMVLLRPLTDEEITIITLRLAGT